MSTLGSKAFIIARGYYVLLLPDNKHLITLVIISAQNALEMQTEWIIINSGCKITSLKIVLP